MKDALGLSIELECGVLSVSTSYYVIDIGGLEQTSDEVRTSGCVLIQVMLERCIQQERTGRDSEHNSCKPQNAGLRTLLGYVVHPKEAEYVAVTFCHRNLQESLFQICCQGILEDSKPQQDVKYELIETWTLVQAVIQIRPIPCPC